MYNPWKESPTPVRFELSKLLVLTPTDLLVAIPAVYVCQVPPPPTFPAMLISTVLVEALYANVLPAPIKFRAVITPVVTSPDAD